MGPRTTSVTRHVLHGLKLRPHLTIPLKNTNVVKLVELLKKNDPAKQVVYYQTGVGTYAPPGMFTSLGLTLAAKADEGVAWFLYQHIIDGYKYLMETYQAGDQVSIFGFSRGAYTARALAGMVHSVGLLPIHNLEHVPFAYQVYEASMEEPKTSNAHSGLKDDISRSVKKSARPENVNPVDFKRAFCISVEIEFLGVWDTVGSVGLLKRKTLPWIEYNPSVHVFRQALALDENRGNFIPSVWDHGRTDANYQSALEIWFKGGHADVGGGAVPTPAWEDHGEKTEKQPLLSDISLRWMVRECLDNSVVVFDPDSMRRYRAAKILEYRNIAKDNEDQQREVDILDAIDIKQKPYIALNELQLWKVLEYLPVPKLSQLGSRVQPETSYIPNACTPRMINLVNPDDPIRIHCSTISFLQTQKAIDDNYIPQATWHGFDEETWPEIEEGVMSSIISESDIEHEQVRKRLRMSWQKPQAQGSWLRPWAWYTGEKYKQV